MARDYQTKANVGALPDTITATRFGAGEFNSIAVELENAVTTSDQTLAPADGTGEVTDQLAMALAIYGAGGAFYHADSGAVNAYVLTPISPKESPPTYFDGFTVIFEPGTENTTASNVNVNSLGVKSITLSNGNPLTGGELAGSCAIKYNLSDDRFELIFSSKSLIGLGTLFEIDSSQVDQGVASSNANTFTVYDVATIVGTSKNATIHLGHNPAAGNQTTFNFDTSLDLSSYPNLSFHIDQGAQISRTTGDEVFTLHSPDSLVMSRNQTLTIVDMIVFSNGGKIYPEWWGAVGDGVTDDINSFQWASDSVAFGTGIIELSAKQYHLSSTWTISPTANRPIWVIGSGTLIGATRLLGGASFTGTLVTVEGNSDAIQKITDFKFFGVGIISQNTGEGIGFNFNSGLNNELIGTQESLIEDVYIVGFEVGIRIYKLRLVNFRRVSVWNNDIDGTLIGGSNYCMQILDAPTETPVFCGDMTFDNCQFVNNNQAFSSCILVSTSTAGNSINGIRFNKCIIYGGSTSDRSLKINSVEDTVMGDFWITNCQFDDTQGVLIDTNGSNDYITDIQVHENYFSSAEFNFIRATANVTGNINSLLIEGNFGAGVLTAAVDLGNCDGVIITDNLFSGCSWAAGGVYNIANSSNVTLIGNNCGRAGAALAGGFTNFLILSGVGDFYIVQGNNAAGLNTGALINNTTGAANTSITGNI